MQGHLTLERICGPDPVPEFRYCSRCDIELKLKRAEPICVDCQGVDTYWPRVRQRVNGSFPPIDPAYEVSLHYPKQPFQCPTQATLDALCIPYFVYAGTQDPIAVDWARNLEPSDFEPDWPIVLISAHGQYVDHWTGFDLTELNRIPTAREAAIQMSQTPHDFVTAVPDRGLVAA